MIQNLKPSRKELNTSVPPLLAGFLSLLIPGLGQVVIKRVQRGILLFLSFITALGIFTWRIAELGRRVDTVSEKISRAFDLGTAFFILVLTFLIITWLLGVWDAYRNAKRKRKSVSGVFVAVLATFFVLGWQISEIDVVRMAQRFPEAVDPLTKVLWPWEAAVEYRTETLAARVPIQEVNGSEVPPPIPDHGEDEPYIDVSPRVGTLSKQDLKTGEIVPGTELTVRGYNFRPNEKTAIWWEDPIGNEFKLRKRGEYVSAVTDDQGRFQVQVNMPYSIIPVGTETDYMHHLEARQVSQVGRPLASEPLKITIGRMIETIFMGMMATIFGIIFSIPISFLAARNIMQGSKVTLAIYYITRTIMNIVRSIEPLIWALIAVVWVGLGPFAGIVALTLHSVAALGKLYSEAIEGIDHGPIEAVQATGAGKLQTIMYAVIPQMISPFVSFSIYRWDINVRMSTVIGLVGGGGIGFILVQYVRLLDYRAAGIAVWFIAVTVAVLDYVSAEIRARIV
ncbi:MAG: phosphonate ABC transporter, permease protein PhnE [Spirochaetia bacterium]